MVPLEIRRLIRDMSLPAVGCAPDPWRTPQARQRGRGARAKCCVAIQVATIPMKMHREGLSLASLQVSLRGRWRGNCHPGELGTALRKLGFKRERRWHGGSGFGALWYPTR
jgi:hypothetical protein